MLKEVKIKLLTETAKVPTCSLDSAGYDLYADEDVVLPAAKLAVNDSCIEGNIYSIASLLVAGAIKVKTGIAMQFPNQYVAQIWDRSSMGVKGIHRLAGVVDSSYRGEILVVLVNLGKEDYAINKGDKIAQILFIPIEKPELKVVEELEDSERKDRGFGSTGV